MSMRGEIISREYNSMVFVHDSNGKEYACYADDVQNVNNGEEFTDRQREKCTDISHVLGDSW